MCSACVWRPRSSSSPVGQRHPRCCSWTCQCCSPRRSVKEVSKQHACRHHRQLFADHGDRLCGPRDLLPSQQKIDTALFCFLNQCLQNSQLHFRSVSEWILRWCKLSCRAKLAALKLLRVGICKEIALRSQSSLQSTIISLLHRLLLRLSSNSLLE